MTSGASPARMPAYRCTHCLREFARQEHLTRHNRTHTNERPYICERCPEAFSRRDLLKRHEIKAHGFSRELKQRRRPQVSSSEPSPKTKDDAVGPSPSDGGNNLIASQASPSQPGFGTDSWSFTQWLDSGAGWELDIGHPSWFADELQNQYNNNIAPNLGNPSMLLDSSPFRSTTSSQPTQSPSTNIPVPVETVETVEPISPPAQTAGDLTTALTTAPGGAGLGNLVITEEYWNHLQAEINVNVALFMLPPRAKLGQYISRFMAYFHRHQPLFHEPTWRPSESPAALTMAVCANGALYVLERQVARDLFHAAVQLSERTAAEMAPGAGRLQLGMLIVAFAAWSGNQEDLDIAIQFHGRLALDVRRAWVRIAPLETPTTWDRWREREVLKRVTYCCFTVMNLMTIAYDISSHLGLEENFGLPAPEEQWRAADEASWTAAVTSAGASDWQTGDSVILRLGEESLPVPTRIGVFGCHVVMSSLCQKIMLFRKAHVNGEAYLQGRRYYARCLRRWQMMWETEPGTGSLVSPDHPSGLMLFNSTALLRVSHIRLAADHAQVRSSFITNPFEDGDGRSAAAGASTQLLPPLQRDAYTCRAALQACLALRTPVHLGFAVVARAGFWVWSVQHALSYFECALLLARWLHEVQNASDWTEDEKGILGLVEQIIEASKSEQPPRQDIKSPATSILNLFIKLLDTNDLTIWGLSPKMARVLEAWSTHLSR